MDRQGLPRINTTAGLSNHAHPPLLDKEPANADKPRVRDLVEGVKLYIVLRGLPSDDRPSAASMVFPRVRRSPLSKDKAQHLDIVSCWKGLSPSQSDELAAWEGIFQECLASQIREHLREGFVKWLDKYIDPTNEVLLTSRLQKFLEYGPTSPAKISIVELVEEMVSRLYEAPCKDFLHRVFPWSLSSKHMPSLVYNFVRTRDCFLYTGTESHVLFHLKHSCRSGTMTVGLSLRWQLSEVAFPNLSTEVFSTETYRISPRIVETSLGTVLYCGYDAYEDAVSYSISSSTLPLRWDYEGGFFHAPVGHGDMYGTDSAVRTVLTAKIVTPFHDGVRFERVTRYLLRANVHKNTRRAPGLEESRLSRISPANGAAQTKDRGRPGSRMPASMQPFISASDSQDQGTGSPWVPSYTSTPLSKIGRRDSLDPLREELDLLKLRITKATTSLSDGGSVDEMDLLKRKLVSLDKKLMDLRHRVSSKRDSDLATLSYKMAHYNAPPSSPATPQASTSIRNNERTFFASNEFLNHPTPVKRKASGSSHSVLENQGRFALDKFEHLDLEGDAKRRKLRQLDDQDEHMDEHTLLIADEVDDSLHGFLTKVTTGPMGEAQTSPTENDIRCWFDKLDRPKAPAAPKPHAATLPGIKHTTFPWKDRQATHGARLPSDASSSHVDEITPPNSATAQLLPDFQNNFVLSQEQIQHNYQEFEERMKRKAAEKAYYAATIPGFDGIVSPTDENDKSFERIFLEDGETGGWESDMEGLSEGLESVCMEEY